MRFFFLLLALALLAPSQAVANPWNSVYSKCNGIAITDLRVMLIDSRFWESDIEPARQKIRHLAEVTCRNYVDKHRNDADHIRAFTKERDEVSRMAWALEATGIERQRFLENSYAELEALGKPFGAAFSKFGCGQGILERRNFVMKKVSELRADMAEMATKCMPKNAAGSPSNQPNHAKAAGKRSGAGAPTQPVPVIRSPSSSDISGTDKKKEKL